MIPGMASGVYLCKENFTLESAQCTVAVASLQGFKTSVTPQQALSSWDPENSRRVCSSWLGISCDAEGHIIKLVLQDMLLFGEINSTALAGLPKLIELCEITSVESFQLYATLAGQLESTQRNAPTDI